MVKEIKKGDWCIITNLDNGNSGIIGHVFQVHRHDGYWFKSTRSTDCIGGSWNLSNIRLATQKEINDASRKGISSINNKIYELW